MGDTLKKAALVGAGLVAGAVVGYFLVQAFTAGDEPPIRVRGGSLYLDLISAAESFEPQGSHWIVTGLPRGKNNYEVYVAPKDPAHCHNKLLHRGSDKVEFIYQKLTAEGMPDGTETVTINSNGNKTKVSGALTWNPATPQLLELNARGYLLTIKYGTTEICSFPAAGGLESALLTEEP